LIVKILDQTLSLWTDSS